MSWHVCHSYFEEYTAKVKTPNSKLKLGNKESLQWSVFRNRTLMGPSTVVLCEYVRHLDPEQMHQHSVS